MADVHRLGYLRDDDVVLDPTYGEGVWWSIWEPPTLIMHDLHKLDGVDWRDLPEEDDSIDVVAFDPPYVAPGGRASSTTRDFHARFGMSTTPSTPETLHDLIVAGFPEMRRVLRKPDRGRRERPGGGLLLLKCKNYVWGGRYRPAAYDLLRETGRNGFALIDQAIHITPPGPQPPHARQVHLRSNYSILFVLELVRG